MGPPLLPPPAAARAQFFCEICAKSYSRQNELDKHFVSYEHTHNVRRGELSSLNRNLASKARQSNSKNEDTEVVRAIQVEETPAKPKKKGGFKKSGFVSIAKADNTAADAPAATPEKREHVMTAPGPGLHQSSEETGNISLKSTEQDYNPRMPSGCGPTCSCPTARAMHVNVG